RSFVADGLKMKKSPWEEVTSRLYLGGEEFLGKMEGLFRGDKNLDIPKYQKQVLPPISNEVISRVAKVYGVKEEEIYRSRILNNEARDVVIYILKKESGLTSKGISLKLGVSSSAVGNRWNKMKKRVAEDQTLARKVLKCQ